MGEWRRIAHLGKPRNLDGGLSARGVDGLSCVLAPGMQVRFVPPTLRGPRAGRVAEVRPLGAGDAFEVHFEGVDDAQAASQLSGCYCLVRREDLPCALDGDAPPVGLAGWLVEDERFGPLGRIVDVQEGPAQALLVVEGDRGGVLVPAVDEFVAAVDEATCTVRTRIPEGLLSL